jgi:2-phospho-L-lactate guanylyltransferase
MRFSMVKAYGAEGESRAPTTTGIRKTGKPIPETHEPQPTTEWVVVIPVKGTAVAKSRFGDGDHRALAAAIALDTVETALATDGVSGVLVVTSAEGSAAFDETEALVLIEEEPVGLAGAIELGIETVSEMGAPGRGTAVLLGDLPAMTSAELASALVAASAFERAMVPDASGEGTTLITAADGATHAPAFGPGSSALHASAGYVALDLPSSSGLRTDVDTLDALRSLSGRLNAHTVAALDAD